METPEKQAKEMETKVAESNVLTLNLSPRQLNVITNITSDKRILQDRIDDTTKREKDAVNLILEAHGVDPMSAKEVRMEEGRLIVVKHPPLEKKPGLPRPKALKEQLNGEAEEV